MKKFKILVVHMLLVVNLVLGFNLKVTPLNFLDLVYSNQNNNNKTENTTVTSAVYDYPKVVEPFEKFKIVQIDVAKNYLVLGARNRIITVNTNSFEKIQVNISSQKI